MTYVSVALVNEICFCIAEMFFSRLGTLFWNTLERSCYIRLQKIYDIEMNSSLYVRACFSEVSRSYFFYKSLGIHSFVLLIDWINALFINCPYTTQWRAGC